MYNQLHIRGCIIGINRAEIRETGGNERELLQHDSSGKEPQRDHKYHGMWIMVRENTICTIALTYPW